MPYRKYKNIPVTIEGRHFDSKAEAARFTELRLLERAKIISSLTCQRAFLLHVNGSQIGKYMADFSYYHYSRKVWVVEDVKGGKGTITPLFRWKIKHVKAEYNISVEIITK